MAVSVRGLYFVVTLFLGSFFGSVFMLGPFLPLMLVSPAWYRWFTDRVVATWFTLPVVRQNLANPSDNGTVKSADKRRRSQTKCETTTTTDYDRMFDCPVTPVL